MTIRVVIVDDQGMVRTGFGVLLNAQPDIEVVGEAVDGDEGLKVIAAGDALLSPSVTKRLIAEFARLGVPRAPSREKLAELTERETEVLVLVARGLSNSEIAAELVVAEQTVKTHFGRILMKLGLRDRAQAIVFAYETGLVRPGD